MGVNEICIMSCDFDNVYEYRNFVGEIVAALLKTNYIMTIKTELGADEQTIISYDYANETYGGYLPYWLLPEQAERAFYEGDITDDEQ